MALGLVVFGLKASNHIFRWQRNQDRLVPILFEIPGIPETAEHSVGKLHYRRLPSHHSDSLPARRLLFEVRVPGMPGTVHQFIAYKYLLVEHIIYFKQA
jgi:hypothetical protein